MKYTLIIFHLFFVSNSYCQNKIEPQTGYIQDENKYFADFLAKKKIIDKNYILLSNCVGIKIDTTLNNKISYNKYFTKFILNSINDKNLVMGNLLSDTINCSLKDYFINFNTTIMYSPITISNNKFFLIQRIKKSGTYNYSSLFMIHFKIFNGQFQMVKKSGNWD